MLQNWLILLPELSLLSFFPVAWLVNLYRSGKTAKTFFTLSKYFLLFAMLTTIIFYNKSAVPALWSNTPYATLFKVSIYLFGLAWFYLSSKWFLNKNRPSFAYYSLAMAALLLFGILLSAHNFIVPAFVVPILCLINWLLLRQHWDEDRIVLIARLYAFFAILFTLLLWGGIAILWTHTSSLDYAGISRYLSMTAPKAPLVYASVVMVMASLLFMIGAVPFHSWFIGIISRAILPVSGFMTLIPPFVYLACLISLMVEVFNPLLPFLRPLLLTFAALSLLVGALSANGQQNIRRLFAFSTVYNLGFMLFSIVSFSDTAIMSAFAYTVIYVLAMAGVYTVFLALKSRGEYLIELDEICGLSNAKPYVSASWLVFMVSLIGFPPLLGFFGRLSVINNLVLEERWGHMALLLFALLFMANAYLQVIRTIYFEPLKNSFDRTDKAIYICLFINIVLVLISILNPGWLLHDAETILNGAF